MAGIEPHGLVVSRRNDGSILSEIMYHHGVRHGTYRDFWPDGRLSLEGQYRNGLKDGEWRSYGREGSLREVIRFSAGQEMIDWDEFESDANSTDSLDEPETPAV